MKKTNDFRVLDATTASTGASAPRVVPSCTVQRETKMVELQGNTLEAQFTTGAGEYLLVLTDDRPFEESLRLFLLDRELSILDSLEFSPAYKSLVIKDATSPSGDVIELQVNDGQHFSIAVQDRPIGFLGRLLLKLKGTYVSKNGRVLFSIL